MSFTPSSPVTGAAVSGFTSPTYTLTVDTSPAVNAKQWTISAIGGTQANVDVHSVSKPFTLSVFKPVVLRSLPAANPVTGIIKNVPVNSYKVITRKGASPAANQIPQVARITTVIDIPAGTDSYEIEDLKAMMSLHAGALWAQASGIADTIQSGTI